LQCDGPIADVDQMFQSLVLLDPQLQVVDQRAVVGQPVALKDLVDIGLILLLVG